MPERVYLTDLLYRRGDGYSDGKELLVGINPRNLLPFMKSKTGTGITEGNWGKTAFAKAIRRTIKPACLLWQRLSGHSNEKAKSRPQQESGDSPVVAGLHKFMI